jgi:calcium-dependent protein kinase
MGCSNSDVQDQEKIKRKVSIYSGADVKKNYELIYVLGTGAFGKVRLYRDRTNNELLYAIKTLKKEGISKTQYELIQSEINILSKLDHPNVVKYFGTFEDDFYLHIMMEYLQGHDLFKIITLKDYTKIEEKDMSQIIYKLFKTLIFLHTKNIVHRDIKPENILFSNKKDYSTLRIIDFGLATQTVKDTKSVGTPYYMSPELIDGISVPKSDVWSVGVIMYQMLTGKFPFNSSGDKNNLLDNIKKNPYNTKYLEEVEYSDEVKDLIAKILVKDYNKRLSSEECIKHPWFKKFYVQKESSLVNKTTYNTLLNFANKPILQKEIYFFIAKLSTEKQIKPFIDLFDVLDIENTGVLTKPEIEYCFKQVGININQSDLNLIWNGLDFHKDNEVSYTEFLAAMVSGMSFPQLKDSLWTVFNYLKEDEDVVTVETVLETGKALNLIMNENAIRNGFKNFKREKVTFEEFQNIIPH